MRCHAVASLPLLPGRLGAWWILASPNVLADGETGLLANSNATSPPFYPSPPHPGSGDGGGEFGEEGNVMISPMQLNGQAGEGRSPGGNGECDGWQHPRVLAR